jgi:hypothetical protein
VGEGGDVELLRAQVSQCRLHVASRQKELSLEGIGVETLGAADQKVDQAGSREASLLSEDVLADRDLTHTQEGKAVRHEGLLDHGQRLFGDARITAEEEEAGGQAARTGGRTALRRQVLRQEGVGNLGDDAGSVAGLPVGVDGAQVGQSCQSLEGQRKDVEPGTGREVGHEPDAARVVMEKPEVHRTNYGLGSHK